MATASRKNSPPSARTGRGILCGTDFSSDARQAVQVAGAIAQRLNEGLVLLHAVEMPSLKASHATVLKMLTAKRRQELALAGKDLRSAGVDLKEQTVPGAPDEVLVSAAHTEGSRLIVVSSLGQRNRQAWLLGSVAARTAERAAVPTLVVRDADPLVAWARGERTLKVFVCFNFTLTSEAALRWVREVQSIGPCEVIVGYVDWPPEQWARLGPPPGSNDAKTGAATAVMEREVRKRGIEILGDTSFRVRTESNWGRPDLRLAAMAQEEGADLIIVGSHQYKGFERVWNACTSRGLLHQATTNVAVVPLNTDKPSPPSVAPRIRNVLVATDFSETANAVIPHAYSLVTGGGTVHLVHVMAPRSSAPMRLLRKRSAARIPASAPETQRAELTRQLEALVPPDSIGEGIQTELEVVENDDVAAAICQCAERHGVDVICLGTRGGSAISKALLGSVARNVLERTHRPLFVLRPQPR